LDTAAGGRRPPVPSSSSSWVPSTDSPGPFARPGKGRVDGAIRCRQLRAITMRRTAETGAFSAPRMRTPLGDFWPRGAFTTSCRPLTFSLSPVGTPESESESARCAGRHETDSLRSRDVTDVDLRVEGLRFTLPVRAAWAPPENAFRRIENLQAETRRPCARALFRKTRLREPFRLLSIRAPRQSPQLEDKGATDFLRASALCAHHKALRPSGAEDTRCVQPTSATHTKEREPAPRVFPTRCRDFRRVGAPQRLRLCVALSEDQAFSRRPRPLRRMGVTRTWNQREPCLAARIHLRGRFLPTMPEPIEPLAPLSPLLRSLHPCSRLRELPPSDVPFEPFRTGDEEEGVARLTLAPNRERRCLKSARDAFHRQGPFVGSGGHYNPGPATALPLARWDDRSMTLSRHRGPCADPLRIAPESPTRDSPFRPTHPLTL
jgi:hypothetical protein